MFEVTKNAALIEDSQTIAVYNCRASNYFKITLDQAGQHLHHMITTLGVGAKVLDLGCGPGTSSAHIQNSGLIPDPIDASHDMVAFAKIKWNFYYWH